MNDHTASGAPRRSTAPALLTIILLAVACSEPPVSAEKAAAPATAPAKSVLAKVGDLEVTEAQVAEVVAAELLQVERDRHAALERGLEQVVEDKLIELEAVARGVSVEELLQQEVDSKATEPTEEQIDAFYEARKAQIRQPKEQVGERIAEFLKMQQQQEARQGFIDQLEQKYAVKTYLDPLRIPVASDGFPAKGPADAPVTIVEFSDFECPYCSRVVPSLEKVKETYGDKVRLVFRQFPLNNIHPNAQKAAEASLCAHEQNRFWELHDAMFDEQKSLAVDDLKAKAVQLELDGEAFNACLDSSKYAAAVNQDLQDGQAAGVSGTPAMFINGRFLSGAQPFEQIAELIDDELSRKGGPAE